MFLLALYTFYCIYFPISLSANDCTHAHHPSIASRVSCKRDYHFKVQGSTALILVTQYMIRCMIYDIHCVFLRFLKVLFGINRVDVDLQWLMWHWGQKICFLKVLYGISNVGVDLWWVMWHWWRHHRVLHHTIPTQNQTIVIRESRRWNVWIKQGLVPNKSNYLQYFSN